MSPNCHYHPEREATTQCPLCQKFICTEDTKTYVWKRKRSCCEELVILQCFLFVSCYPPTEETITSCVNCYEEKSVDLQGTVIKDI